MRCASRRCRRKLRGEDRIVLHTRRTDLAARTPNQQQYLRHMLTHDISFGIGPAGTGKTFLAVACAVDALERNTVQRIVLTRPAVEAGERLGFLPGDMAQKVDPYLRPLYDALYDLMGLERVTRAFDKGLLEVAPLAFMRGRTLNHAFVILDEAQNTTSEQMKMFLTRIGFGSRCVVTGDTSQIDLPKGRTSGLVEAQAVLAGVEGVAFTLFTPPTWCATRWWRASSRPTTRRARAARRPEAMALPTLRLSLQMPDARHRAVLPRHRVARWVRAALLAPAADHRAHRRRGRRPRAEPRLPRQGPRHQRADLRLRGRAAGRRPTWCCARRWSSAKHAPRAGRWRPTTRTCWCMARCMRRASITRPRRRMPRPMEARESAVLLRLGFDDPYVR